MIHDALPPGTTLHEYRIESVLGQGAFAITYKGWDAHLQSWVAIKEYFPGDLMHRDPSGAAVLDDGADAELYEWGLSRFVAEAQVLAQFRHPNIVRVSRYFPANRTAYIVMDYEQGESLNDFLARQREPIDEAFLRGLFVPLLHGLKVVHGKHYLHRDVKPGNIYLRADGSPVLLDFGAARLEFGASGADAMSVLTPRYAPIEQYTADGEQGPWSDLYGLGATLYRCVVGEAPVEASRRRAALDDGRPDPQTPASRAAAGRFGSELLDAIDWALALLPRARPQSAPELLARLTGPTTARTATPAVFQYQPRRVQRVHKIVFAGPVGVGKTTAIATLSDTPILRTDAQASDMTRGRKGATTVAMDFGVMNLSDTERIHLYGMPGQERFDFMWDILTKGALGLVLLLDNSRREPFDDLDFYLHAFRDLVATSPIAIGINFMDGHPVPSLEDYHAHLARKHGAETLRPPVFEVDARDAQDVGLLIEALLLSIDPGVEDYDV